MARIGSTATGGFFPTPGHLVPRIAALFARIEAPPAKEGYGSARHELTVMDPCAGTGEAVLDLVNTITGSLRACPVDVKLYMCELEASRHALLKKNAEAIGFWLGKECLSGDAFGVTFKKRGPGVSLLYLNPPYDTDRVHGRLEHRFLDRFTSTLSVGGYLVFVVPLYALKASAALLGLEYTDVWCFRFPKEDHEAFKQVVLVARKGDRSLVAKKKIVATVEAWAAGKRALPELPEIGAAPLYELPLDPPYHGGLEEWRMRAADIITLLSKIQPWSQSTRSGGCVPIPGVLPERPVQELLLRYYPVAMPPRPAHIAAGIASGLFNGARIEPTDPKASLPSLLVKGVFDREYRTIEEKHDKEGNVKGLVQVQQPKLVTTVLNLETHTYHVLSTGTEETGSVTVDTMNVADLLKHYGESLMEVMKRQCPVLYDPRRDAASIPLAKSPRKLFTAQAHAAKALVKLLGGLHATKAKRRGKSGMLLGEIGSGKSTVALVVGRTIQAKRFLIMCPPHLLKSWRDEIAAVFPDASVRVLASVEDLQEVERTPIDPKRPLICILSREVGKLTHAWEGVGAVCPKCGHLTPSIDLAKKRARCEHQRLIASDVIAREMTKLAVFLSPMAPTNHAVSTLLRKRFDLVRLAHFEQKHDQKSGAPFLGLLSSTFDTVIGHLFEQHFSGRREDTGRAILALLLAIADAGRTARAARLLLSVDKYSELARDLLVMLPPGHPEQEAVMTDFPRESYFDAWTEARKRITELRGQGIVKSSRTTFEVKFGQVHVDDVAPGSLDAACRALSAVVHLGSFRWAAECGEELFGAIPEPRRVSLARHILRYHRHLFDFLVLDEAHEYSGDGTAQERSAHRLTSLQIPTILMTGTVMNGYAESLFANMWAMSPEFRLEFDRDERQRYIDRYGYRKRLLQDRNEEGEIVAFGSQSDRITRSEKIIGNAPGILPLFLLKHLLPVSVTLHKTDLALDLPRCTQHKHVVTSSTEVKKEYDALQLALVTQIRKDQFEPDFAGRLFGQLAELPSYLDRATSDVGNVDSGAYEIRYPESLGSKLVAAAPGLSPRKVLPKEEWMLDLVERELAEGRNVMVFSWHVALLPRLARLISKRIGEPAAVLYADKVSTGKRQDWIDREVVKKGRRVLVCNPVVIQTGLNNLVHFASEIWMENPACNPVIFRQAVGRVDRIGQKLETRVHVAIYGDTLQVQLYDLLMRKVAVSVSADGLDPESALIMAGAADENMIGLSIGRQLWAMLNDGDRSRVRVPRPKHDQREEVRRVHQSVTVTEMETSSQ